MKIWLIDERGDTCSYPVAAVDTDHLGEAIKRCKSIDDLDVNLDDPIELNMWGVIRDHEIGSSA